MNAKNEIPKLVDFIKQQVSGANRVGCVVGVSGGIDSAVIVALCKLAYPDTTVGVNMPYKVDNKASTQRAEALCKQLDVPLLLDIVEPVNSYKNFPTDSAFDPYKLAQGNMQARMRMAKLYYHAERLQCLVVGTDNKSENYIGFFTKFGDGGVDINPIGQYYKSEVYELAKELGITQDIIDTAPTPEFTELTDEEEFGFTYDELELAIRRAEDNDVSDFKTLREKEVFFKVRRMHLNTEHKRIMPLEFQR